jgi:hypothetical protein
MPRCFDDRSDEALDLSQHADNHERMLRVHELRKPTYLLYNVVRLRALVGLVTPPCRHVGKEESGRREARQE